MDITLLIQQANRDHIQSERELYSYFIYSLLTDSNLTSLLSSTEKIKKELRGIFDKENENDYIKTSLERNIEPSEGFYNTLSLQSELLAVSSDNEFVVLLASLKMLERLGFETIYKDVLREIVLNNLHKIKLQKSKSFFVGREEDQDQILRLIHTNPKKSLIIIGPDGIGKTSIIQTILEKLDKILSFQLFPGGIPYDRIITLRSIVNGQRTIFFLDEISLFEPDQLHNLLENEQIVATSNDNSFIKFSTNYPEIASKFEVIRLKEVTQEEVKQLMLIFLQKLKEEYKITWDQDFIDEVYSLSKRYVVNLAFPEKGLSLIEESVSLVRSQGKNNLSKSIIDEIISQKTSIPISDFTELDKKDLTTLKDRLRSRVKGQDRVIDSVVKVIQRSRLGFSKKNKPIGSFLFIGPSGVGKTELAKAIAQFVYGDEENLVRLDMSEFAEAHNVQRLIGAPPGYVGFEEGGQLTNPIKDKPYNLVLLDELEKAHPRVFDIFLQVLDDGRLTDGQGKMVDFRNTIIVATSNAGLDDILDLIEEGKDTQEIEKEIKDILQDFFRLEFINRFDGIILFNALEPPVLEEIALIEIEKLKEELSKRDIEFSVSSDAIKQMASLSYDPRYGARELLRFIQDNIENKLAEMIIAGELQKNQKIVF